MKDLCIKYREISDEFMNKFSKDIGQNRDIDELTIHRSGIVALAEFCIEELRLRDTNNWRTWVPGPWTVVGAVVSFFGGPVVGLSRTFGLIVGAVVGYSADQKKALCELLNLYSKDFKALWGEAAYQAENVKFELPKKPEEPEKSSTSTWSWTIS
ncbi:MAG: hypothetical protein LRY69_01745 [Gammaproteobacteria bacterium]|nr:hypothetical protein [Gammaproteobacteria bacterium]